MKKTIILFAAVCFLTACGDDENVDILTPYFFNTEEDTSEGKKPDDKDPKSNIPTEGLVAYYPLDGNADDKSGNKYNGEVHGNLYKTSNRKGTGFSLGFPGTPDDYIRVPFSSILTTKSFTLNAWVYNLDASNKDCSVISCGKAGVPGSFWLSFSNFRITDSGETNYLVPLIDKNTQPKSEKWVMLTATIDDLHCIIYVNGEKTVGGNMKESYTPLLNSAYDLKIGISDYTKDSCPFYGYLDDIRIYNRALTAQEIQLLYKE